jgi:dihydropteroate synthase
MTGQEFTTWLDDAGRRPLVMGVLNVTPDSFSDGGRFSGVEEASARAEQMCAEGADLIDIGGESTRPGSQPVPASEQIRRVVPVFQKLAGRLPALLSIDTTRSEVVRAAAEHGASIINDTSGGLDDAALLPLLAELKLPVILMHMQGRPPTMQNAPQYGNVVAEVKQFLADRLAAAQAAGIDPHQVLLDPGIGFGKAMEHNLALLRELKSLTDLGRPLVLGTSRKGFIGRITGETDPADRLFGTAASVAWCVANGAAIVRVHDVGPMTKVVRMIRAIQNF